MDIVPPDVRDMWEQVNEIGGERKKKKVTVSDFNCKIEFAFGGLHGVHKRIRKADNLLLWDVALT